MREHAAAVESTVQKKHNLWIIRGNAYDLTEWALQHPGGSEIIEQTAGTDCTSLFESYHALSRKPVHRMLKKFLVRPAYTEEQEVSMMWPWEKTPIYDELKERVKDYLAGRSPKAPKWLLATWYPFWLTLFICSIWSWLTQGRFLHAVILGVAIWYASADVVHCGSHFALFESPGLNLFFAYTFGWLHATPAAWIRQHNLGHHTYTNTLKDPDIYHHDVHIFNHHGWRNHAGMEKHQNHAKWRYVRIPFTMLTGVIPSLVEASFWLLAEVSETCRALNTFPKSVVLDWESKLSFFQMGLTIALMSFATYAHGFIIAATPFAVHGMMYHYFTQLTHINEASHELVQGEEWAIHQVRSASGDFGQLSHFWLFTTIGLNLQGPHHIFPSLHWFHYPAVYRILQEVLGETLPKTFADRSFAQAYKNWAMFLDELNVTDEPPKTKTD